MDGVKTNVDWVGRGDGVGETVGGGVDVGDRGINVGGEYRISARHCSIGGTG
jgi:hypothetical protein